MRSLSIVGQSVLALSLMVGFYGMAIGLAACLLYVPYAEVVYTNRIHFKLVAFCVVGAGVILAAIVPRREHFTPPGPRLGVSQEPRLFGLIMQVAKATHQRMPRDVYVIPDVNAWVTQIGGVMGIGGRRVMGLGLPLIQALTVSELQAVLAHEFGHYYGGDTKLGTMIYQTRAAIGRAIVRLREHSSWLHVPFILYATLFLRLTRAVSRYQEYAADRIAASVAGPRAVAEGLKKAQGGALAYDRYRTEELQPVLEAGYFAPVGDGFRRYLTGEFGAAVLGIGVDHALKSEVNDPYDTHPPLRDRLAALRKLPGHDTALRNDPASGLLKNIHALEWALIGQRAASAFGRELTRIEWDEVVETVHLRNWMDTAEKYAGTLLGRSMHDLGKQARQLADTIGEVMTRYHDWSRSEDDRRRGGVWVLGAAVTVALVRAGWSVQAPPGARITVTGPAGAITPFDAVTRLVDGDIDATGWYQRCAELGVSDLELWSVSRVSGRR